MRRPALSRLAVGGVAAVALSLSAAAPGLADDATPTPSASETTVAAETLPPADPTAPVEASTTVAEEVVVDPSASVTPTESATTATASELPAAESVDTATPSATPTIGGNGAYSYPFVLTTGEAGATTVAIEVAGTGVSVGYTLDEQGKVTDAVVAAGAATLVKSTPHTIFLVLETGETVKVKVHGDSVRVKVKPVKGGPLRPGISTPEEVAADEAAETAETAEVEETEAPEAEDADEAKPAKEKKAKKENPGKGKGKGKNKD
ncbi:MAG: hypothetical protein Q8R60_16730 [Mycobacteriales bacterium]|nr:hypothetical protein [Mycobacteriales bacterium]